MCLCPQDLSLISDFLNSCRHSLNPIRLSGHAKPFPVFLAVWCLIKRFNGIMQIKNNFENAIWQLLLNTGFKPQWVIRSALSGRKKNVHHVWDDVVIEELRGRRTQLCEGGGGHKKVLRWKECFFCVEFSDVLPCANVKESVWEDLLIFRAPFCFITYKICFIIGKVY